MESPDLARETTPDVPAICHIPPAPVSPAAKRIVLLIAILAGFITPFDGSAVNIALPAMGAEFHMDAIALSWIATAYLLAAALFLVPLGKIADIYGRKRIFMYGIAIFSLASLVMTMVPSTNLLIAVRIIQGFGGAMIFGTSVAILTSVFPPGERGKALGIYITAVYFGLTVGPFLGGVLTENLGWRSIFFVNVPIGIITCLLIMWKLEGEWAECDGERFDLIGSVIYASALVCVMYGFSLVPSITGMGLIAAGCAIGILFALYEMRIPMPVLDMRLLTKNRVFAFSNLAALISYSATFAVTFLLSLDLQYTKDFSPEQAGLILIVQPAVMALVSPLAGRLSDRVDPQIVASTGMAFSAFGLFLLAFLVESTPLWYLLVCLAVLGAGLGMFSSPNTNAIMSAVEKRYYGVASGMNGTMRLLGQMFSMGVAMMLFALLIGRVEITPEYYPQFVTSLHYAFVLFTVLCILGTAASLNRGKRQRVSE
ncbi:MAG: MFS transporter [Methanoregula sp.]|jgi:EmrB/QacA subfamily drug resistance transporter